MTVEMTRSENVRTAVQQMSIAQKIGQMVMVDFSGYVLTESLRAYIAENQIGGIILFAKNVQNRVQVGELCADLQRAARDGGVPVPLFLSIDQEGGIVNRIAFAETAVSPGNMAIGATGQPAYAYDAARIYGEELASLGINLNFAPCVDVNNNPFNPIIGARSFGESAEMVSAMGVQAARGYREGGVLPTAKHFPGHGDTAVDSHLDLPSLNQPMDRLEQVELAPYRALIADGLEMVMTAHITYPALEEKPGLPATLSHRILTGLLRETMGFEGVIITDSMAMLAVARNFGVGPAAVMAVQAGADIVLACGTREAQLETLEALLRAVREGTLDEARVDASVERILALKEKFLSRPVPVAPSREAIDTMRHIARAAVTVVKDVPGMLPLRLSAGEKLLVVAPTRLPTSPLGELDVPLPLAQMLRERGLQVEEANFSVQDTTLDLDAFMQRAAGCSAVLACLFARNRLSVTQMELALSLSGMGKPMAVVAVNSPYVLMDVPWIETYLCTYGYTRPTLEALAEVITGRYQAQGRLPVSIPGLYPAGHRA